MVLVYWIPWFYFVLGKLAGVLTAISSTSLHSYPFTPFLYKTVTFIFVRPSVVMHITLLVTPTALHSCARYVQGCSGIGISETG